MKHGVQPSELMRELAGGEAVSGAMLAARLGVTRAAIWKQMAALRALGLPIEGRSGGGYRLPWPTQLLDAGRIEAALTDAAAAPVQVHWTLDSTQDELARHLRDAADLTVVLAEHQQAGRGRRGRGWHSPPGSGICLSCLKRFAAGPAALSGLSIAVGVCVVRALVEAGVPEPMLKWPNDVVTTQGKLAGILIEVGGESEGPCVARVGVGLNLRPVATMHAEPNLPAVDLATLCGGTRPDRNQLAAGLIRHLRAGLQRFEQHGLEPFAVDFARLDALAGQPLQVRGPQGVTVGIGRGIDTRGALCVETDGRISAVCSGEVSVRAWTHAGPTWGRSQR